MLGGSEKEAESISSPGSALKQVSGSVSACHGQRRHKEILQARRKVPSPRPGPPTAAMHQGSGWSWLFLSLQEEQQQVIQRGEAHARSSRRPRQISGI